MRCFALISIFLVLAVAVFAEATVFSDNFINSEQPIDGIVGFAFQSASYGGLSPTLIDNLHAQVLLAPLTPLSAVGGGRLFHPTLSLLLLSV
jgi:hypothetical protein